MRVPSLQRAAVERFAGIHAEDLIAEGERLVVPAGGIVLVDGLQQRADLPGPRGIAPDAEEPMA